MIDCIGFVSIILTLIGKVPSRTCSVNRSYSILPSREDYIVIASVSEVAIVTLHCMSSSIVVDGDGPNRSVIVANYDVDHSTTGDGNAIAGVYTHEIGICPGQIEVDDVVGRHSVQLQYQELQVIHPSVEAALEVEKVVVVGVGVEVGVIGLISLEPEIDAGAREVVARCLLPHVPPRIG